MDDEQPTHLDLFSGFGGFALAAKWAGFRTIGFCEIDKYCQKVLAKNFMADAVFTGSSRSRSEHKPKVSQLKSFDGGTETPRIFSNIFDLDGREFSGVDLITGGFPCQPFSVAGKRRGAADDRALWPEMFRVIREARPAWVLGENVPGIVAMELDNVLSQLESIGYATRAFVIPACAVDARHRRDRVWIIAHRNEPGLQRRNGTELCEREGQRTARPSDSQMADSANGRLQKSKYESRRARQFQHVAAVRALASDYCRWQPEPDVGGILDGISSRLDEIGLNEHCKTYSRQTLRTLWCTDVEEAFQWTIGRFRGVETTEVLLTFLRQYEAESNRIWTQMESRTNAVRILRNLWREIESSRSSHQRKYSGQFSDEYSNALWKLSRKTSSLFPQAWSSGCWEDGIERVATKIPNRVDRLKGLGNAIVPQVAYQILKEIRKLI